MTDWAQITTSTELVAALTGAVGAFSAWWLTARKLKLVSIKQHLDAATRGDEVDLKKRIELDVWTATQFERLDKRIAALEQANLVLTNANTVLTSSNATLTAANATLSLRIEMLTVEINTLKSDAAKLIEMAKVEAAKLIEMAKVEAAKLIEMAKVETVT